MHYTGSVESFREVVDCWPVPLAIVGCEKMGPETQLLNTVENALKNRLQEIKFFRESRSRFIWFGSSHENRRNLPREGIVDPESEVSKRILPFALANRTVRDPPD
jgi:hypothetical protein